MNPRLMQIMRNVERKHPPAEKAPASGDLGAAIEQLIAQQVEERVSQELDRHRERLQQHSPRVQQLMRERPVPSSESSPPAPRTAPPVDYTTQVVQRDEAGRMQIVELGGRVRMEVQRDALGRVVRMVEIP